MSPATSQGPCVNPGALTSSSGPPQPSPTALGTATSCCQCGGVIGPMPFPPDCGPPCTCNGNASYSSSSPECCCPPVGPGGPPSGPGNGGAGPGSPRGPIIRGISSGGFADDPLAYASKVAQNIHGYDLRGPSWDTPTGPMPFYNFSSFGVIYKYQMPSAGSLAPPVNFTQNSVRSDHTNPPWGNNTAGSNGQTIQGFAFSSFCFRPINCCGGGMHYEGSEESLLSSTQVPADGGAFNKLEFEIAGDDSLIFTETQPNGLSLRYEQVDDELAKLVRIQSPARGGNSLRWTITQDVPVYHPELSVLAPSRVVDPRNRRTTYAYDGNDRLRSVRDVTGRIYTFTSASTNGSYNLTGFTTPDQVRTTLTYVTTPWAIEGLSSLTTPDGGRTTYTYTGVAGAPTTNVLSPLGYRTTFTGRHSLAESLQIDPRGYVTTLTRIGSLEPISSAGAIRGIRTPLQRRFTFTWGDNERLTVAADAGGTTTFTYATLSTFSNVQAIASVRNQASGIFTYVYDANDRISDLINQKGDRTTLVWDADGFRTAVINAKLLRTSYSYNNNAQITAVIDPLLRRTTYVYDAFAERSAVVNPAGERTTYVYNGYGQTIATINPLNFRTTQVRDVMNRVTADVDANGFRTTYLYDAMARRVATIDPLSRRTTQVYDLEGRTIATVDSTGSRTSFAYDGNRNRISMLDPLQRRTTYVYDPDNQLVAQVNPLLQRTSSVYDGAGNRVAAINPLLQRTTTVYDADRRVVGSINGLGQRSTIVYDGLGSQIATVDALGRRFTTVYDSLARRIATTDPLLDRTSFVYDNANRMVARVSADLSRTTYAYDLAGRPNATIDPLGSAHHQRL